MHPEALEAMTQMLKAYPDGGGARCLDVGSRNVNGSYRYLAEAHGWKYTGLDLGPGDNVDVIAFNPYSYPFPDGTFEIVVSGCTLEHVQAIWRWVPELVRVLRPGGLLAIVAPHNYAEHRHPIDCWRVLPDGMRFLFDLTGQLERYDIRIASPYDVAASAWKVA